jgi:hypothetical protein
MGKENEMKGKRGSVIVAMLGLSLLISFSAPDEAKAQYWGKQSVEGPRFKVDPFWPKPLPNRWVFGELGAVCTDKQDHVFVMSRGNLWPKEAESVGFIANPAPAVVEFDADGNVVNSWGQREMLPNQLHGCFIDSQGNFWTAGYKDGIIQEYTHDGSKMLLQIGTKGKFDSADGTDSTLPGGSAAMNSSRESFNSPTGIAVDSTNGDVYVSDGYGNRRIAVFDRSGHFLRQWGRQGTLADENAGAGGVFLKIVHCVLIGNDGFVYVCDRNGDRIEVFDKMGDYKRSIASVSSWGTPRYTGPGGTCDLAFSPDATQKYLYISDCTNDEVHIVDRVTGATLSSFGRAGQAAGDISSPHNLATDSKGNIYVAGSLNDRRVQKFVLVK